ncbi:hypothetical protein M5689_006579 [Euphorbia peplus]|nr:hypothetical protein M5689_006579 [Euphorbia peplus]
MEENEIWRMSRFKTRFVMSIRERFPDISQEDLKFFVNVNPPEDDEEADAVLDESFPERDSPKEGIPVDPISAGEPNE